MLDDKNKRDLDMKLERLLPLLLLPGAAHAGGGGGGILVLSMFLALMIWAFIKRSANLSSAAVLFRGHGCASWYES